MLRGAVFDFDGVIVDSHPAHLRAWKKFLGSVGKTASEEQLQFVMDGRKRDDILRHFMGDLDEDQIVEYGLRKEQCFRDEVTHVHVTEGLLGFLDDLQSEKLSLAIASSGSKSRILFLLDRFGLKKYFREIVSGDEVYQGKPNPAVFVKAADQLGANPSELMAFEDAVAGVNAAKSAGMKCVGIAQLDRAAILLAAGANHVVPDFRSLTSSKLRQLLANGSGTNSAASLG